MSNIAFIFPGQGAQYVGMGKELYESYKQVKDIFDKANELLNEDLRNICFNGPSEDLMETKNTQPAILTLSTAIARLLMDEGIKPGAVAGLSLGEYSALVTAGALKFEDAVPLVRKRGLFMEEAVPTGQGTMAAIIGLDSEKILKCCSQASSAGVVEIANYNSPNQIVISGHTEAVKKACELCKGEGAKRAILLEVSGPFHSSLLQPAGEKLGLELSKVYINVPSCPVISNVEAKPVDNKEHIRDVLVRQVSNSVKWEESVRWMIKHGINIFLELGPGKALSGFVKRISKDVKVYNVENVDTLNNTLKELGGEI